jgi:hypothetical protein
MPRSARSRAAKAPKSALDPHASGVVLAYVGGRTKRYVPARDLEGPDLARIAYRRALDAERSGRSSLRREGEEPVAPRRPGPPDSAALAAVADELVASGFFTWPSSTTTQPAPEAPAEPEA